MFLPIGDEPNAPETPWATYGLIAANVAVWVLLCWPRLHTPISLATPGALDYLDVVRAHTGQPRLELLAHATAYDVFVFRWGYRPAAPHIETLLTSMFLHGGWLHLLGNMLFLYIFGDNVEARLGPRRYVAIYLACGIAATLFYAATKLTSPLPLVGASGAISGVLGCYFLWFPNNRVRILYTIFFFISRTLVPARLVLLGYFLLENLLPFLFGSAGAGGTAYGAHLGGFVAGFGYAWYEQLASPAASVGSGSAKASPWRDAFERRRTAAGDPSRPAEVSRLLAARRYAEATAQFHALSAREQRSVPLEDQFAVADFLTEQRRFAEATLALKAIVAPPSVRPADKARAHLRLGLLYLRGAKKPALAYPHLLDALDLAEGAAVKAAAAEALGDIERTPGQ